jgi:type I restriction enzyme R subunit
LTSSPGPDLAEAEKREVKLVARDLLVALKTEKLVLDWRKRQQTRAAVRVAVEDAIWQLPERFTDDMCQQKSALVYQHIYDNYQTAQRNTYAQAA